MLNIEKSSLILILIIVVLIAGFVSLVTLGYTPGSVWHKAEDIKPGEVGKSVGATATSTYLFPNLEAKSQVTAGTKFHVGSSDLSSSELKVNNNSLVVTTTGNVGIGTTNPQAKLEVNGNIVAARPTTPDQLATKGYVDEVVALVESIVTGAQPLVNGAHSHNDCINAGGEVVDTDVEFKQCKFNASSCPSGWTHYKGYAATAPRTCIPRYGDYGPEWGCTTPSRAFGNYEWRYCSHCLTGDNCGNSCLTCVPSFVDACCYCDSQCATYGRTDWCFAIVTQIGCY